MKALDRKLIRDLIDLRSQFIAVSLVVICGVASFVSMSTTYRSLVISQASYYHAYRLADVFAQMKRAPETVVSQIRAIPGVTSVETRVVFDVVADVPGLLEPATLRLVSVPDRRTPILNDIFLRRGRYVEPGRSDEIIISEAFAEANRLEPGNEISAVINGRWKRLRVVGVALSPEYVYEVRGGADILPDNKRFGVCWMSRQALGPAFNMEGAFDDVSLLLAPGASEAQVLDRLDRLLAPYGGLGAYGREDQLSNRFLSDEIAQNRVTGTIFPVIFLGVAAFLLSIVLSRLVTIQRAQIAILKAFGYSGADIGRHYLKLTLLPVAVSATAGTALGLYLGFKLTEMYALFYRFPELSFEVEPGLIGLELLLSLLAAGSGVLGAVRRAVKLPPAEAMRPEPPARFRAGFLEKAGLERIFSPVMRMILRNLARRPVKAFFSALGIAMAVAILFVGLYFYDAMDHLLTVQFFHVQREDITVVLNEPRPARARFELTRLPGVLHSETFRAVPARLRFGHRVHRTALFGLPRDAELRQIVGADLRPVTLPPEGVILTKKLAEILGVRPGDVLTVEVLEGARPVRQVVIAGLVDELLGIFAYMDAEALNRFMREGGTVSGAFLSVDPARAPELYSLLKRMPTVSGISVRQAALASFQDIVELNLLIFTAVLVSFACIIVFGMVYNGARISLSERERDLASLRVLGFTRAETGSILLGEQAAVTSFAIPLGLAIGFGISALMPIWLNSELYRMPLVIRGRSVFISFLVVAVAALVSGLVVRWRVRNLDLVAVLKTRE